MKGRADPSDKACRFGYCPRSSVLCSEFRSLLKTISCINSGKLQRFCQCHWNKSTWCELRTAQGPISECISVNVYIYNTDPCPIYCIYPILLVSPSIISYFTRTFSFHLQCWLHYFLRQQDPLCWQLCAMSYYHTMLALFGTCLKKKTCLVLVLFTF